MKEIWTLIIKTSLPEVCRCSDDLERVTLRSFDEFEKAKKALREELQRLVFSPNKMFDAQGNLIYLKRLFDDIDDIDAEEDDQVAERLTRNKIRSIVQALRGIVKGEDKPLDLTPVACCSDWAMAVKITKDEINMYGHYEGPINGYDPRIETNMFDMTTPKNYYLYIDDMLGQTCSSELYVDLVKTVVE